MYTEICHYLLFYFTFSTILWILYRFIFFVIDRSSSYLIKYFVLSSASKKKITSWKTNFCTEDAIMSQIFFSSFFLFLSLSFFGTINNYICSDFSIYNTTTNSTADIPLFYKISATWSNHEGSLLLWCWLLSFSAFVFLLTFQSTRVQWFSEIDFYSLKQHFQDRISQSAAKSIQSRLRSMEAKQTSRGYLIQRSFDSYALHFTNHQSSRPKAVCFPKTAYKFSNYSELKKNKKLQLIPDKMIYKFEQNFHLSWKKLFHSTFLLNETQKEFHFIKRKAAFVTKMIVIFFTTFCIMTSNPFLRTAFGASINSLAELNPILQDPILAIHPPCIYIGYVTSGIAFSLCVALLSKTQKNQKIIHFFQKIKKNRMYSKKKLVTKRIKFSKKFTKRLDFKYK